MPRYRITIISKDREAMLDLVRKYKIQVSDHGNKYSDATGYTVDAVVETADIKKLKTAGYRFKQHEDVDQLGKVRQKEVGTGDRYKDGNKR